MTAASSIGHLNKCEHAECLCQAEPGERFCSDYCRGTQESRKKASPPLAHAATTDCGCGHSACEHLGSRE